MKHLMRMFIAVLAITLLGVSPMQAASKPTMNVSYTDATMNFVAWQYSAIPASDFLKDATSAEITVKGAVFVAFGYAINQWNYSDYSDGVFNWSDSNVSGVTYTISGETLEKAKNGGLYVRTDKSSGLTLIVKNIGEATEGGNDSGNTDTPTQPEEEAEEEAPATEYSARLNEWNDIQITASAFVANATSANISVKGASYVRISKKVNGSLNTIKEFSWNGSNQSGVSYSLSGEDLTAAINGNLYIYVGGGNPIDLTITNTVPTEPEPEVTPTEPEPEVTPTEPEPEVTPTEPEPEVTPTEPEPEVTPTEPEPEVTPTEPEPEVTPTEPEPEVTPTEPEPEVTPTEPEPEVTPTEPEPEVTPTEPEPEVTPTEPEPEVTPTEPEPEVTPTEPEPEVTPTEPEPEVTPTEPEPEVTPTEPEPEVTPTEPEPETPAEEVYGILNSYEMTLSEWNNIQIPASAFDAKAEDVKVVVAGASYVKYMTGSTVIAEYPWSDNTKFGAILELNDAQIAEALKGNFYTWVGGGNPVTLTVTCYGMGGTPEPLRDPSTLDMLNYADRSYAIAHKYQLTDVPTLYLTIPDAEGKDLNSVLFKDRSTNTAEYHAVTVEVVDNSSKNSDQHLKSFVDDGEIKVRGNSTAECVKKPYRIKFPKKHKHDLLGLGYDKRNWVLLANYLDPAMIRNAMSYYFGQEVGMPFCPGYKFVDVVINDDYRGTYQITDQIEVGKNRIDVDEDTGWYIEVSRIDMIEDPCLIAGSLPMSIKNPEPDSETEIEVLKNEVSDWFSNVSKLFFSYNEAQFTNPETGWRAYFDEESLVDYYLAVNLAGDYDGFMTVKMYRETDGKMFVGPLWDKDLSAGNYEDGTKLIEEHNNGQFVNYLNVLLKDPGFVKKVHDKLAAMVDNGIEQSLLNYVDQINAQIQKTEVLNHSKWQSYTSWKLTFDNHEAAIAQLKDYYTSHVPFVVEKIQAKYDALGCDNLNAKINSYGTETSISSVGQTDIVARGGKGTLTVAANGGKTVSVYSLAGVEVARAASGQTISLPAGTYLVGGNKVIVK